MQVTQREREDKLVASNYSNDHQGRSSGTGAGHRINSISHEEIEGQAYSNPCRAILITLANLNAIAMPVLSERGIIPRTSHLKGRRWN